MITLIDNANNVGSIESWRLVGEPLGQLMADFLYYEIPNYEPYTDYTVTS